MMAWANTTLGMSVVHGMPCFLSRMNEVRLGSVVGKDEFGNRYFENKQYFYGKYLQTLMTHALMLHTP